MDVKYSRRILGVGSADSGILDIIKDLTGSAPILDASGSTAGVSHEWNVQTAYYSATVPIWLDEVPDVAEWESEFLKPEAKEVVEAVGAWIYCFRRHKTGPNLPEEVERMLQAIQRISETHTYEGADVVMLAVAMPASNPESRGDNDWWIMLEDMCVQFGFEAIDYSATGTNEFGEKTGHERLKEVLEANEWSAGSDEVLDDLEFGDALLQENDTLGFGIDEAEMTAELFDLKAALADGELADDADKDTDAKADMQEENVEQLERLMHRLLAVKEQSANLPEPERKRMAARAVRELMADS